MRESTVSTSPAKANASIADANERSPGGIPAFAMPRRITRAPAGSPARLRFSFFVGMYAARMGWCGDDTRDSNVRAGKPTSPFVRLAKSQKNEINEYQTRREAKASTPVALNPRTHVPSWPKSTTTNCPTHCEDFDTSPSTDRLWRYLDG